MWRCGIEYVYMRNTQKTKSFHLLKLYKLKMFKSNDIAQDIMLNIWAYNMMSLILNFLLILISEVYWQSLNIN